ncbi:hypothetical protein Tco_0490694 [Tanacetum coccineum]
MGVAIGVVRGDGTRVNEDEGGGGVEVVTRGWCWDAHPGPTAATISSITITTGDGMPRMRTFRETVSPESSSTNGRSLRKSLCDGRRNMVLSRALMSMGRVSETRLRRRRAKQSGGIDIEFKTVNEYSI